jgi:putative membrane protein
MLKQALALVAVAALTGCSASMDMNPNGSHYANNTNSHRYDNTYDAQVAADRNNAGASATVDTSTNNTSSRNDTYTYRSSSNRNTTDTSGYVSARDDRDSDGPIMTDPIGRPERMGDKVQRDLQASASSGSSSSGGMSASARMDADRNNNSSYTYSSRTDRDNGARATVDTDGFASRNNTGNNNVTVHSDTDSARTANATVTADNTAGNLSAQDRQFVDGAVSSGMFEVRSAQLVKDRINDESEKQFAQMMIDDHTKANNELKDILRKKGITPRTDLRPQHQSLYESLTSANGNDLLNQYKQQQVTAHEQTIKLFEDEANNGQDPELKSFAQRTLPVLKQHLEGARSHLQMNDNMNK